MSASDVKLDQNILLLRKKKLLTTLKSTLFEDLRRLAYSLWYGSTSNPYLSRSGA